MTTACIVSAVRTAIGGFGGTLQDVPAPKLGAIVIKEALQRAGVKPEQVDEVVMGCVLQAGTGQGPGRQAAIAAGIPDTVPAWSINQLCGSGLKTVTLAATAIAAGEAQCMVVGGFESMSLAPHIATFVRNGKRLGNVELLDTMLIDGLVDVFSGDHMGLTAEAIAAKFGVTRGDQDAFAVESQRRAAAAQAAGNFDKEIVPVPVPQRKGDPIMFAKDEHPRATSLEAMAKLRPAFKKDGTVTAGNASGINDGAAALVVVSEAFAQKNNLKVLARIKAHATTALEPYMMGLGPIEATRKALGKAGWTVADLERVELNEAFAAQAVAVVRELGVDPAITNPNGGAIALGHPIGASGARILVSLLHEMERAGAKKGLASLCVGGGMGVAVLVEA